MAIFPRYTISVILLAVVFGSGDSQPTEDETLCDPNAPQSYDGTCNNLLNPAYGSAFTAYIRGPEGAEYEDGISQPVDDRPSPRIISNAVGDESPTTTEVDPIPHTMMAVMFGQFLNHDFESNDSKRLFTTVDEDPNVFEQDLQVTDPNDFMCFWPPPPAPGGQFRCQPENGPYYIQYRLSAGSISQESGQFEVDNRVTSYLDLGSVYGNNDANATVLREFQGGRLKAEDYSGRLFGFQWEFNDLPPSRFTTGLNTNTLNQNYLDSEILTAGDFRVNNNVALAGFHTLFLREHNRLAAEYEALHDSITDEEIFQAARRRNIAQYQKIVLEEYLPAEFGSYFTDIVGQYEGYDASVDASTASVFSSAAFRYGHSAIRGFEPLDECGLNTIKLLPPGSEMPNLGQVGGPFNILGQLFLAGNVGFETVMRGLIAARTRPIDTKVDNEIRNLSLPSAPGEVRNSLGIDVFSFDILRGRLNGIPNYDSLREVYHPDGSMYGSPGCGKGLIDNEEEDDPLVCFVRLVSGVSPGQASVEELDLAETLKSLYRKINKIDGFVGMLAEPKVDGTSFGETLGRIVADQYKRARDGDRFWYENVYGPEEQEQVRSVTMKTLLERNFDLEGLPEHVFLNDSDFPVC